MVKLYAVFVKMPSRSLFQRVRYSEKEEVRQAATKTAEKAIKIIENYRTKIYQPAYELGMVNLGGKLWVHINPAVAEKFAREVKDILLKALTRWEVIKALAEKYNVSPEKVDVNLVLRSYLPKVSPIEMPPEIALELVKDYLSDKLETLKKLRAEAEKIREKKKKQSRLSRIRQLERYIEKIQRQIAELEKLAKQRQPAQVAEKKPVLALAA
jgi:hypothetical protein